MHHFIMLLLDLHPVDPLRYVSNNLRSNQQAAQSTLKTWTYMSYVLYALILVQITCKLPDLDFCHWTTSGSVQRTPRPVQVQQRTWKEQIDFQPHYLGVLVRLWEAWFSTILVWLQQQSDFILHHVSLVTDEHRCAGGQVKRDQYGHSVWGWRVWIITSVYDNGRFSPTLFTWIQMTPPSKGAAVYIKACSDESCTYWMSRVTRALR